MERGGAVSRHGRTDLRVRLSRGQLQHAAHATGGAGRRNSPLTILPESDLGCESARRLALRSARELEDGLKGNFEHCGDPKRDLEGRRVLPELDGVHRLTGYPDAIRERLLSHFAVLEA